MHFFSEEFSLHSLAIAHDLKLIIEIVSDFSYYLLAFMFLHM